MKIDINKEYQTKEDHLSKVYKVGMNTGLEIARELILSTKGEQE